MKITTTFRIGSVLVLSLMVNLSSVHQLCAQGAGALFEAGPNLLRGKIFPTSTLLSNGNVITFSGREYNFVSCTYSDLYHSTTNTFSESAMNYPHDASATVKLIDGRYLLLGGGQNLGIAPGYATTEIYDPSNSSFTISASMLNPRMQHVGVQLSSGKVLVAGAWYNTSGAATGELYDLTSNSFSPTSSMVVPRSQPNIFPASDGGAIICGGWPTYGGAVFKSVEYYSESNNTFTLQSTELLVGDSGWIPMSVTTRPFDDCRLSNGKYLMMAYRDMAGMEYALLEFDPVTKLFSRISTSAPLMNSYTDAGFADFGLNRDQNLVYLIGFDAGFDPQRVAIVTVDLGSGQVYHPQNAFELPAQEYFYASYTYVPGTGKILVMGINASNTGYFEGTNKTYLLSPEVTASASVINAHVPDVKIFPNPANEGVTIRFENYFSGESAVRLNDISGRICLSEKRTVTAGTPYWTLNTSALSPGVYLLTLTYGQKQYVEQVLIGQ